MSRPAFAARLAAGLAITAATTSPSPAAVTSPAPAPATQSHDDGREAASLLGDLGTIVETPASAGEPGGEPHDSAAGPRVIYLWYADGQPPPSGTVCGGSVPPSFACQYGASVDECESAVQPYLDRWYADFDVVFTVNRPTGGIFYTVVVTSSGTWCPGITPDMGGVAPFRKDCGDFAGNTAYAFKCGDDARACAVIVAQEQAHLVGLQHTNADTDVMAPKLCGACNGFEDKDNPVATPLCASTQNSHQLMLARLGPWPGGDKPSALAPPGDSGAPAGGGAGGSDDGSGSQGHGGGCSFAGGIPSPRPFGRHDGSALVALAALAARIARPDRLARRACRAVAPPLRRRCAAASRPPKRGEADRKSACGLRQPGTRRRHDAGFAGPRGSTAFATRPVAVMPRIATPKAFVVVAFGVAPLLALAACSKGAPPPPPAAPAIPAPRPTPTGIPAPPDVAAVPADAEKSASGLAWKVLTPGSGKVHPGPTDKVKVKYVGWTADGRMFDTSSARGPVVEMQLDQTMKGWMEGLPLMVVGEKRRFWVPPALAYNPRPGRPAAMLVFDIELVEIGKGP